MFLTPSIFLLVLPALIFAKTVPQADNSKTHCLQYGGFSSAMVTFNDPAENSMFDYAVVTKYNTYYPDILTYAFAFNGFTPSKLGNDRLCGWKKIAAVHGILGLDFNNHRGDMHWKYSDLRLIDQPKNAATLSNWTATDPTHYPPFTGQTPSQEATERIRNILIVNPPAGDVFMFCTIILAWTTSLLGYILFMMLLMTCISKSDRNTDESKDTEIDEGIELDSIKAPDMDSLAGSTAVAASFEDVKWDYPSPQPSTDTMRSESLPTYSRWVSGHGAA
jgi:hypothetical protein